MTPSAPYRISLGTLEDVPAVEAFYPKLGFVPAGSCEQEGRTWRCEELRLNKD